MIMDELIKKMKQTIEYKKYCDAAKKYSKLKTTQNKNNMLSCGYELLLTQEAQDIMIEESKIYMDKNFLSIQDLMIGDKNIFIAEEIS